MWLKRCRGWKGERRCTASEHQSSKSKPYLLISTPSVTHYGCLVYVREKITCFSRRHIFWIHGNRPIHEEEVDIVKTKTLQRLVQAFLKLQTPLDTLTCRSLRKPHSYFRARTLNINPGRLSTQYRSTLPSPVSHSPDPDSPTSPLPPSRCMKLASFGCSANFVHCEHAKHANRQVPKLSQNISNQLCLPGYIFFRSLYYNLTRTQLYCSCHSVARVLLS
ncbi:hypothetical protein BJ878DRAFT_200857 [Calycina marina]|uniref:Uncharacterized protein n=1 Tax=Calycina marina TaxID=1763456 RepID=A0A9P7Z8W6_9HELO|nr:hypothetical protein BJ878DRAFT_200857 [Calycina marina]